MGLCRFAKHAEFSPLEHREGGTFCAVEIPLRGSKHAFSRAIIPLVGVTTRGGLCDALEDSQRSGA
jgi:hypothetical protein